MKSSAGGKKSKEKRSDSHLNYSHKTKKRRQERFNQGKDSTYFTKKRPGGKLKSFFVLEKDRDLGSVEIRTFGRFSTGQKEEHTRRSSVAKKGKCRVANKIHLAEPKTKRRDYPKGEEKKKEEEGPGESRMETAIS